MPPGRQQRKETASCHKRRSLIIMSDAAVGDHSVSKDPLLLTHVPTGFGDGRGDGGGGGGGRGDGGGGGEGGQAVPAVRLKPQDEAAKPRR